MKTEFENHDLSRLDPVVRSMEMIKARKGMHHPEMQEYINIAVAKTLTRYYTGIEDFSARILKSRGYAIAEGEFWPCDMMPLLRDVFTDERVIVFLQNLLRLREEFYEFKNEPNYEYENLIEKIEEALRLWPDISAALEKQLKSSAQLPERRSDNVN